MLININNSENTLIATADSALAISTPVTQEMSLNDFRKIDNISAQFTLKTITSIPTDDTISLENIFFTKKYLDVTKDILVFAQKNKITDNSLYTNQEKYMKLYESDLNYTIDLNQDFVLVDKNPTLVSTNCENTIATDLIQGKDINLEILDSDEVKYIIFENVYSEIVINKLHFSGTGYLNFAFSGSNDGITFTELYSGDTDKLSLDTNDFSKFNDTYYQFYKIELSSIANTKDNNLDRSVLKLFNIYEPLHKVSNWSLKDTEGDSLLPEVLKTVFVLPEILINQEKYKYNLIHLTSTRNIDTDNKDFTVVVRYDDIVFIPTRNLITSVYLNFRDDNGEVIIQQIHEILLNNICETLTSNTGDVHSVSANNLTNNDNAYKLFDNVSVGTSISTTDDDGNSTAEIIYDFKESKWVFGIDIDYFEALSSPKKIEILGSNDNSTYTSLYTIDYDIAIDMYKTHVMFGEGNYAKYQYIKIKILTGIKNTELKLNQIRLLSDNETLTN